MKKILVLISLVAAVSAYSQGQVTFNNLLTAFSIDAPIRYDAGGPADAGLVNNALHKVDGSLDWGGTYARAGLYGGAAGTAESELTLLTPSVPFRSGATAGYVNVTAAQGGSTRTTALAIGSAAVFQVRAWDAGQANITTYEAATALPQYYWGKSALINIAALGGGSTAPSALVGLTSFSMTYVPEPSIIGLGLLGAIAGLFVFRRRN
jgi:hypothetical protein